MALEISTLWDQVKKDIKTPLGILFLTTVLSLSTLYNSFNFLNVGQIQPPTPPDINNALSTHFTNIATLHLFGDASGIPTNLPKTQLQLTLQGIALAATPDGQSRALIAGPDQITKVYKKGDTVPGGAVIREINREQVILDFNGALQTLNLPVPKIPAKMITKVAP